MEAENEPIRALVVDDEPLNLKMFERVFRNRMHLELAASGPEALERLAHDRFDIVFADFAMPGMSGVELLQQAMEQQPHVRRAIITGHYDLPEVQNAQASGVVQVVFEKPWRSTSILDWVERCRDEQPSPLEAGAEDASE